MCSSGYVQRIVEPAPSRGAGGRDARARRRRRPGRRPSRREGRPGRSRVPPTRNASDRPRLDVAERLHELERHLLVLDRVDEPVAQAMPNAEDLLEPRQPRAALPARAAGEVREVDGRARLREPPQPVEPRRGEDLRGRREVEPGALGEAVPLAHEGDGQVRLARGDVRLEQAVADVLAELRARERQLPLEVLRHDDRHVALHGRPSRAPTSRAEQLRELARAPSAAASAGRRGR